MVDAKEAEQAAAAEETRAKARAAAAEKRAAASDRGDGERVTCIYVCR